MFKRGENKGLLSLSKLRITNNIFVRINHTAKFPISVFSINLGTAIVVISPSTEKAAN